MTPAEDHEMIERLFDLAEVLLRRNIVLQGALDLFTDQDWRPYVDEIADLQIESVRVMLQPLRDVIVGNPSEILEETEWRRIVRDLIRSAEGYDSSTE